MEAVIAVKLPDEDETFYLAQGRGFTDDQAEACRFFSEGQATSYIDSRSWTSAREVWVEPVETDK
jgi:hypothetical protein